MARFFLLRSRRSASPACIQQRSRAHDKDVLAACSLSVSVGVEAFLRLDLGLSFLPRAASDGAAACFGSVRDSLAPVGGISWD